MQEHSPSLQRQITRRPQVAAQPCGASNRIWYKSWGSRAESLLSAREPLQKPPEYGEAQMSEAAPMEDFT
eukprot:scaffold1534_cov391-Prasinococcus_capsulatus_cf.AAC.7